MASAAMVIHVQDTITKIESPLANAWVYWRPQATDRTAAVRILRTDLMGRVYALVAGGDRTQPWDYSVEFAADLNSQVSVYFSRGSKPIPDGMLAEDLFVQRAVVLAPSGTAPSTGFAPVNTGSKPNALSWLPTALMVLPDHGLRLNQPNELNLWPLYWELPPDNDLDPSQNDLAPAARRPDYATAELTQGARLTWETTPSGHRPIIRHATASALSENGAAPTPPDDVAETGTRRRAIRPREQALSFEISADAQMTGIRVQLLDRYGRPIQLRTGIERSSTTAFEVEGRNISTSGGTRIFKVDIHFAHVSGQSGNTHAPSNFGFVQLAVRSIGVSPPVLEVFTGVLCGFQIAFVDDFVANPDGRTRGPTTGESDETLQVDFLNSPQSNLAEIRAQTRVRRMQAYEIRNQPRRFGAAGNVMMPQMPLWMAEFQVLGLNEAILNDLMARFAFDQSIQTSTGGLMRQNLKFELDWSLRVTWDGPDRARDPAGLYRYDHVFSGVQTVKLKFDAYGALFDDGNGVVTPGTVGDGEILNPFESAEAPITFPIAGRRAPRVMFVAEPRPWGRFRDAATRELLVVEFQPRITERRDAADQEMIRGGDGRLSLGVVLNDRRIPVTTPLVAPLPGEMRLPPFRIRGRNMDGADVEALIDALASDHLHNPAHAAHAELPMLPEAAWQDTCRLIFKHETGGRYYQFDDRPSAIRFLRRGYNLYYANENGMPFFGGPHGYGICQVDYGDALPAELTRAQLYDELWSIMSNLRGGVRHVMGHGPNDKARAARSHLQGHMLGDTRRMRAVYQREIVRRYNGNNEFTWNGSDWVINPGNRNWEKSDDMTQGANSALLYPNQVLCSPNNTSADAPTRVTYFSGGGEANRVITGEHAEDLTVFNRPATFSVENYGSGI